MDGKVTGIISLANVKDLSENEQAEKTVEQVMAPINRGMIIPPDTPLIEALKKMSEENVARLLVMRGDHMMGMITQTGLLRVLEIKRVLMQSVLV
jgi:predicted transcriptional regulator